MENNQNNQNAFNEKDFFDSLKDIPSLILKQTIIRNVWNLPVPIIKELTSYFRRSAIGSEFISQLSQDNEYVDILLLPKRNFNSISMPYQVTYQSTSFSFIEDNPDMKLILSFRALTNVEKKDKIVAVIVRPFVAINDATKKDKQQLEEKFATLQRITALSRS